MLSSAFSLNASARQGACKRSRFKSKGVSLEIKDGHQNNKGFSGGTMHAIFQILFRNDDVCFFVWTYEMEQFKLKVGWCFALISFQRGDLICLLLGASILY